MKEILHTLMQVLPHGIEATKYQPAVAPLDSVLGKSFVFLFNGGLLPRKGIDILLQVELPSPSLISHDCRFALIMESLHESLSYNCAAQLVSEPQPFCARGRTYADGECLKHCGLLGPASSAAGLGGADCGLGG